MNNKIYLAGPDVFRDNPTEYFMNIKILCKKYDFEGFSPFDNENFDGKLFSKEHSRNIFFANVDLIRKCDIITANIIPFRGACVDDGTAWEIARGYSMGKIIYGYTPYNNYNLPNLTKELYYTEFFKQKNIFPNIESFANNQVNLMIQESIELSNGKILKTFEDCLIDLRKQLDEINS